VPTLGEIMTGDVFTTTSDTTIEEVAKTMVQKRIGSAVVMEAGWLGGIFTERDVLRAAAAGTDVTTATVGEWMTKDPVTVAPDTEAAEATQIMVTHGFRHLPVVEGKTVLGIVSLRDVLSARIGRG
jgi:CBS domain-containing protein